MTGRSKQNQERRRDDALRRALAMPPKPLGRSAAAHVRLIADASSLLALVDSANRALEAVDCGVGLPNLPEKLVAIKMDAALASGAGELGVRLDPSDGFCGFVTALRAWNSDFGAIE